MTLFFVIQYAILAIEALVLFLNAVPTVNISHLILLGPILVHLLLFISLSKMPDHPCSSFLHIFRGSLILIRALFMVIFILRVNDTIEWSWNTCFWPIWILAMGLFILVCACFTFFFMSASNFCRQKEPGVHLVVSLWMLLSTIGFFMLTFLIPITVIEEMRAKEANREPKYMIQNSIWFVVIYLIIVSITFAFLFSDIKLYFEKMLYNDEFIYS